jgi:hypothetical protein
MGICNGSGASCSYSFLAAEAAALAGGNDAERGVATSPGGHMRE